MAQLTDYWRKVADRCLGKEYDTLRALMAEDRGSKEVNRGRVFLSKVASTDLGEKHVRIEMTMNALARRVVDRKLLEHLDSAWGADHRKEFDLLFTGHPELFKASHRDAPVRFSRWFYPVCKWTQRVYGEIAQLTLHLLTAKRLGLAE